MKTSDIAKKYNLDENEFMEFVTRKMGTYSASNLDMDSADENNIVRLFLQEGGKQIQNPSSADRTYNRAGSDKSNAYLEKIARNVEQITFWIKFWSIISLISVILVVIYIIINVL